jgi:hypothetical protein
VKEHLTVGENAVVDTEFIVARNPDTDPRRALKGSVSKGGTLHAMRRCSDLRLGSVCFADGYRRPRDRTDRGLRRGAARDGALLG